MPLLDQYGKPFPTQAFAKLPPPKMGEKFGSWGGNFAGLNILQMPGGGLVQFDLSKLTLNDFRTMTYHYQVNSSLAVLSFMLHQSNWTIDCDNKKVKDFVTENIKERWTQLNRSMSQANWAGYSPNVLQWANDVGSSRVVLDKIKDLMPESCVVNWDFVDGYAPPNAVPPRIPVYDGIIQFGWPSPIPKENSFWYPVLMENGNYYGKKLLKPAFTSYFFSILTHLYANRYYERFGEPVPVGRAPFDEVITLSDGTQVRSNDFMLAQIMELRNRSVVVLPSDRDMDNNGRGYFDYDLQYLEPQMRGADFERYMTRLDEEISLAIFTPILLMRTADVGSYNLGVGHMQMYLWMLNALNDDRAQYIDSYIINPLVNYNFAGNIKAHIKFAKLDNSNADLIKIVLQALIGKGEIKFDLNQLGEMAGLTIDQAQQLTAPQQQDQIPLDSPSPGTAQPNTDSNPGAADDSGTPPAGGQHVSPIRTEIVKRVQKQIQNAYTNNTFGADFRINMGFMRRMEQALVLAGVRNAEDATDRMYARMDGWAGDVAKLGNKYLDSPASYMSAFENLLDYEIDRLVPRDYVTTG